jgi:hypothetical protein
MVIRVLSISGCDYNIDAGVCILVLVADAVDYPWDDIGFGVALGNAFRVTSCSALPNTRRRTVNHRHA